MSSSRDSVVPVSVIMPSAPSKRNSLCGYFLLPSIRLSVPLYHRQKHSSDFQEVQPFFTKKLSSSHGHTCHPRLLNFPLYNSTMSHSVSERLRLHHLSNNNSPSVKWRYNIKMLSSSSRNCYGKARTYERGQLSPCNNCDMALCCSVQSSHRLPGRNATGASK